MPKSVWDLTKILKKYNRKAKLHGVVKSIKDLYGWNRIITEMQKGNKSPTDPYIKQILHDCVDVLKEAKNYEARRLTGLARNLLLFSDLCEELILGDGCVGVSRGYTDYYQGQGHSIRRQPLS